MKIDLRAISMESECPACSRLVVFRFPPQLTMSGLAYSYEALCAQITALNSENRRLREYISATDPRRFRR